MSDYFITGTDTGVGKTWATLALMKALQDKGKIVVGMKPVASGCQNTSAGLRNDDARQILKQSSNRGDQTISYKTVNPYAFKQAIAPHIAADLAGVKIDIEKIAREFNTLKKDADSVLVEGVGGWNVPLGPETMLVDMVEHLDLNVILVVGLRLGCINHALSAARSIEADGMKFHGWITSQLDPNYACLKEAMATLRARINAPLLGSLPYMESFDVEIASSQLAI
jgi:dethiobiotin synthetase